MSFLQKIEIRIEKWQRIIHKQSLLDVERLLWRSDNRKYQNTAKKKQEEQLKQFTRKFKIKTKKINIIQQFSWE
jgi:hypothetical protein